MSSDKELIASRVAMELKDGDVVNLGIGIPTMVSSFMPEGIQVILHAENGIIDAGPPPAPEHAEPEYVVDSGGKPASCTVGGAFIDSCTSFGIIRGGHIDITVLGALQVDEKGNLANWIIPGHWVPGMGGAMDLVVGAKRVIIAMEHTVKGKPKILKQCNLPLTAVGCVNLIITEMGVMEVGKDGIVLKEYNSKYSVEDIKNATECELIIPTEMKEMNIHDSVN